MMINPSKNILRLGKGMLLNLNRNWLGYLIFLSVLYLFTPFSLELNDWPTIRARLTTVLELPVTILDTAVAAMGDN